MTSHLVLIIALLANLPSLSVEWLNKNRKTVSIAITEHDPIVEECQKSGSQVYYRYEYQLCRKRRFWFDNCKDTFLQTRLLQWDPISETYEVSSDILGDPTPPSVVNTPSLKEAMVAISNTAGISIKDLAAKDRDYAKLISTLLKSESDTPDKLYLHVRAKFICKGQTNATIDRLSSIITLGLVSVGTTDSGWIDFPLKDLK